jgi:hypothetical protein
MGRIVLELVILVLIVGGLLYFARQWDAQRRAAGPSALPLQAPPDATWQVRHVGNDRDQTEILLVLRDHDTNRVWDRRSFTAIENQDPDYDKRFYNAMEDARARAALLNSQRP